MKRCQAAKQGMFRNLRDSRCARTATHGCFCWQHRDTEKDDGIINILVGKKWNDPMRRASHRMFKQLAQRIYDREWSPWFAMLRSDKFSTGSASV